MQRHHGNDTDAADDNDLGISRTDEVTRSIRLRAIGLQQSLRESALYHMLITFNEIDSCSLVRSLVRSLDYW